MVVSSHKNTDPVQPEAILKVLSNLRYSLRSPISRYSHPGGSGFNIGIELGATHSVHNPGIQRWCFGGQELTGLDVRKGRPLLDGWGGLSPPGWGRDVAGDRRNWSCPPRSYPRRAARGGDMAKAQGPGENPQDVLLFTRV